MSRGRSVLLIAICVVCAACGQAASAAQVVHVPSRILPAAMDGYTVQEEGRARSQFDQPRTQVTEGRLFTLRSQGTVYAALEIGVLRSDLDTSDVDTQYAIRKQIGSGSYRYIRLAGQWVADQPRPDVHLIVWFPGGHPGIFEVLTVSNQMPHIDQFVSSLLQYQEGK